MPFYNGEAAQTEQFLETTDILLQSIVDQFASECPIHIIGDLNVRLPQQPVLHKNWYKKHGFNKHSNVIYKFINDNNLHVADFNSNQNVHYTNFCDTSSTYTWVDHCLTTSNDTVGCQILARHADNVSDHLPVCLWSHVTCDKSRSEPTVLTHDQVPLKWDRHECTTT